MSPVARWFAAFASSFEQFISFNVVALASELEGLLQIHMLRFLLQGFPTIVTCASWLGFLWSKNTYCIKLIDDYSYIFLCTLALNFEVHWCSEKHIPKINRVYSKRESGVTSLRGTIIAILFELVFFVSKSLWWIFRCDFNLPYALLAWGVLTLMSVVLLWMMSRLANL